jgi:hypothetical protein
MQEEELELEISKENIFATKMYKEGDRADKTEYMKNRIKRKRDFYEFLTNIVLWFT